MVNLQVYATSICYTALHNNDTTWRNGVLATLMKGTSASTCEQFVAKNTGLHRLRSEHLIKGTKTQNEKG